MTAPAPDPTALLAELVALQPDERLTRLRTAGPPAELLIALADEAERLAGVEVARAVVAAEMVAALADEVGAPLPRARARRARGQSLAYAGRFADALPVEADGVAIATAAGEVIEAARGRLASVHALAALGRHDEAVAAGEAARAAFLAAGEPALAARADLNLGATYRMRDDPRTALIHYARARSGLAGEPVTLAQLDSNRGIALMSLDDLAAAETAFAAAAAVLGAHGLGWAAAVAEGNLAALATRQGRLSRALFHFEHARRHLEVDDSPAHLARLRLDQAEAFEVLGLPHDALTSYEALLPRLEAQGMAVEAAQARAGAGRTLLRLDRREEAAAALTAAATAFDALGQTAARARLDLTRAALMARDRPEAARALAAAAAAALLDRPLDAITAGLVVARLGLAAGDLDAADEVLGAAIPAAEGLGLAPLLAEAYHLRGLVHRDRGDAGAALRDLRAAVAEVERVRGTLQAERFRTAFLGDRLAVYEDLVLAALDRGDDAALAEAFATVERAKSRALLDIVRGVLDLAEARPDPNDPAEAALLAWAADLRARLNWLYSQLDDHGTTGQRQSPVDWRRAVQTQEHALEVMRERVATVRGAAGLDAPPTDLAGAHDALPADAAMVEYFVAGGDLLAFVLRDGDARVFRRLIAVGELVELARQFRFQVGRALAADAAGGWRADRLLAEARRALGALHATLLAPLRGALGDVGRVIVVPHGPLHTVPFHALWDGERYLIEEREVVYAPSASVLTHLGRARNVAPPAGEALVVGVPDAAAPEIAVEAARVARTLAAPPPLLGAAATVARVTAAAERAAIIHLACHGRFSLDNPLGSGLRLADRWLTLRDVYALRLRAPLVTLSGCDTGRAAIGGGDELVGLMRGFFAAGATSLIVSLWTVHDESAAETMTAFYEAWQAGASKAAALRHAQRSLLAERPHPASWAPFILGGMP